MKLRHLCTFFLTLTLLATVATACDDSPSGPDNSPLTEAEIRAVAPVDFEVLALAYANVVAEHPGVDEESNAFARLLLAEVEELSGTQGNLILAANAPGWSGLTDAEWDLIWSNKNWLKIPMMKAIKEEALALAAVQFPAASLGDGTGDAFRHAYWNARMAQAFGLEWANAFATAHESTTPAGSIRTMDLNNNEVGRKLFAANSSASASALAALIKAYPLACMSTNAPFDSSRLLYVEDCPTVRVFDDGPDFDDVFEVSLGLEVLGTTPKGGGHTWETSNLVSGTHNLHVKCLVDGTNGGCGFKVILQKGLTFTNGTTSTPQQVVSKGATGTLAVIAPTLEQIRQQSMQSVPLAPTFSTPSPRGARP
ncbi:MAG TPA: hypothetical protein VFS20_34235 [Longimicrobium sp.]|nr:hypothetical protein [Longimicrobium sp.]